ncbi:MAG: hypothetical protein FH749_14850 [Firmicutes bacterium]|nr:hypothetical protein [Bacillota bacterium]
MRKVCFISLLFVLLAGAGCASSVDEELVGHWLNVDYGDVLVLTDDGKMGIGYFAAVEEVTFNFRYTASQGSGEFWIANNSEEKAQFTYYIDEDYLQFNVAGGDPEVGGDSGEFIRIELLPRE